MPLNSFSWKLRNYFAAKMWDDIVLIISIQLSSSSTVSWFGIPREYFPILRILAHFVFEDTREESF